jgi:thymidine kinase
METGKLELILGTMFGQKTTELILKLKKFEHGSNYEVQLFKPTIDTRYATNEIVTHDGLRMNALNANNASDIVDQINPKTSVIGIDEAPFFDSELIEVIKRLVYDNRKIVIVSGLLYNFRNEFFQFSDGQKDMSDLLALIPDEIVYKKAFCKHNLRTGEDCNQETMMTQRFMPNGTVAPYNDPLIMLGKENITPEEKANLKRTYSPRCREHFKHYDEVLRK